MSKTWILACIGLVGAALMVAETSIAFDTTDALGVWLLNEGEGDVVMDSSGNGPDGVVTGTPNWVDGKFGKALSFDGEEGFVEMDDLVTIEVPQHTISVWVNPGDTQDAWSDVLGNHTGDVRGFTIEQRSTDNNTFFHGMGINGAWQGGPAAERPATVLTPGEWQHLVVQRDGTAVRHYLNNEMTAEYVIDEAGPIDASEENLRLGAAACCAGRELNGMIDEVGIWARVLSMGEIMELGDLGIAAAVDSKGKLATTWASLRGAY